MIIFEEVAPRLGSRAFRVTTIIGRVIPARPGSLWKMSEAKPPRVEVRIADESYRELERVLGDDAPPQSVTIDWRKEHGALPEPGSVLVCRIERQCVLLRHGGP